MQIGPRIRIGGTLGKAGKVLMPLSGGNLTKLGHAAGKLLDNKYAKMALAAGLAATGVGAAPAALLMAGAGAGGKLMKKGGNIGQALKQGAVDGISGYGAGKLIGSLGSRIPGANKVLSPLGKVVGKAESGDEGLPPVQIGTNPDGSPIFNPGMGPEASSSGGDRFRGIGDFLSSHKDDILDYGAAAEGIYDKYRQSGMQDEGLRRARDEFNRRQPLRDAGMAGMLDQSRPDLSSVFADPGNPVGRYRTVNVGSR